MMVGITMVSGFQTNDKEVESLSAEVKTSSMESFLEVNSPATER